MNGEKRRFVRVEIQILAQEAPRLRLFGGGAVVFVSERLDIAYDAVDHVESALERRTLAETAVPVDGADLLAQYGMRLDVIARDGERATEILETAAARFTGGGKAEGAIGAALAEPEAGACVTIVKFDAHPDIATGGAEAVDGFRLARFWRAREGGAPQKRSSFHLPAAMCNPVARRIALILRPLPYGRGSVCGIFRTHSRTDSSYSTCQLATMRWMAKLDLLQGTLDMMVMRTLKAGAANGYEIAKAIERVSGDVLEVDHGSLYPALHRLEKNGVIAGKWEISSTNRRARFYRLTPAGRKRLVEEQSNWEQMAAAITRVMRPV